MVSVVASSASTIRLHEKLTLRRKIFAMRTRSLIRYIVISKVHLDEVCKCARKIFLPNHEHSPSRPPSPASPAYTPLGRSGSAGSKTSLCWAPSARSSAARRGQASSVAASLRHAVQGCWQLHSRIQRRQHPRIDFAGDRRRASGSTTQLASARLWLRRIERYEGSSARHRCSRMSCGSAVLYAVVVAVGHPFRCDKKLGSSLQESRADPFEESR